MHANEALHEQLAFSRRITGRQNIILVYSARSPKRHLNGRKTHLFAQTSELVDLIGAERTRLAKRHNRCAHMRIRFEHFHARARFFKTRSPRQRTVIRK